MGFFDNILGKREAQDPNEALLAGLSSLDPALSIAFRAYITNRSRISVLSKEAVEQYLMVKSKTKNEQTREMEPYFRQAHELIDSQRKLLVQMHDVCKKRRFRMVKEMTACVDSVRRSEETLRRIQSANNDPAINRLQGMNDALTNHKSMELGILWPALR